MNIFVSVGSTATDQQEAFVRAVEDRLRSEGLEPHSVGRNTFSSDAPLKTVTELLKKCSGVVVIALERTYFPAGAEKRGSKKETALSEVRLPTPWNQIEAAMAYTLGRPLLMIVEEGVKSEGLLERGYDWYVQFCKPDASALTTAEFNGVLASWKGKIIQTSAGSANSMREAAGIDPSQMSVGQLLGSLRPGQLWAVIGIVAVVISGAFAMGAKLISIQ
jgi:hypothetical protein